MYTWLELWSPFWVCILNLRGVILGRTESATSVSLYFNPSSLKTIPLLLALIPSLHQHFSGDDFWSDMCWLKRKKVEQIVESHFWTGVSRLFGPECDISNSTFFWPTSISRAKTNQWILNWWHVSSWMIYQVILPPILWYSPYYLKHPLHRLDHIFLVLPCNFGGRESSRKRKL